MPITFHFGIIIPGKMSLFVCVFQKRNTSLAADQGGGFCGFAFKNIKIEKK